MTVPRLVATVLAALVLAPVASALPQLTPPPSDDQLVTTVEFYADLAQETASPETADELLAEQPNLTAAALEEADAQIEGAHVLALETGEFFADAAFDAAGTAAATAGVELPPELAEAEAAAFELAGDPEGAALALHAEASGFLDSQLDLALGFASQLLAGAAGLAAFFGALLG